MRKRSIRKTTLNGKESLLDVNNHWLGENLLRNEKHSSNSGR